jgi:hypothetical protein
MALGVLAHLLLALLARRTAPLEVPAVHLLLRIEGAVGQGLLHLSPVEVLHHPGGASEERWGAG